MANSAIAAGRGMTEPKTFDTPPDVLIQDPRRDCAYLISSDAFPKHLADSDVWGRLDAGTVTFVIPGGDVVEEIPPFAQASDMPLSVLVQDPGSNAAYFFSEEDLDAFRVDQPSEYPEGFEGISFLVPDGTELIDEIPTMRRARLQCGT